MRRIALRYCKVGRLLFFGLTLQLSKWQRASVQKREPNKGLAEYGNRLGAPRPLLGAIVIGWMLLFSTGPTAKESAREPPAAERDSAQAAESFNAYYQATYIWQRHGAFRAIYTGSNSLIPEREKGYSFTATGYFGWRLWPGGELYVNPEVVQAVALSHLTGLGGLTNGENQKTAGSNPTFYRARLFVRQTWGLGGGKERVGSSANQLAGEVERRRLVLIAGNLAVIDIFDANPYAHDPRANFLNWALMTHGAYDYAADARGYSWGAALEYYYVDWALRAGRFLQPRESNGLQLDYRPFGHYGDQVELEHAHEFGGRPGKVRFLAYRNYARMGGFGDALNFAAANGGTPDVANVRKDQAKHGYGINLNQALTNDLGVLARASWSNGAAETYAFTEIERSLTFGVNLKGSKWGRPEDTVYVGTIRNGLSAVHRNYLAAGGLGFFIGDGQINYRPEKIFEAAYVASVARGLWVAPNFQHIQNPAYNADRGPVNVIGIRLHAEF